MRLPFAFILPALLAVSLPAQAVPVWRLQLVAKVNAGEQLPAMLGNVTDVAVRSDGGVYIAEEDPDRVTLYDAHGQFVRIMMRDGAGPGETSQPEIIARGDTLIAFSPQLHRLTWLAGSGRILREQSVGVDLNESRMLTTSDGSVFIPAGGDSGRGFDGSMVRVRPNGHADTIKWVHPNLEDRAIVWRGPHWVIKGRGPYSPLGVAAVDPQGELVVGGTLRSRWFVVKGKDTLRTVAFTDTIIPIGPRVRDSVFAAWFSKLPKNFPDLGKVVTRDRFPTTLPPWVTFDIDRAGNWWIGRPGANGTIGHWDVVVNGKIVGRVAVPAPLLDVRFKGVVTSFAAGYVAMVHEGADGAPWIGVYRVIPK